MIPDADPQMFPESDVPAFNEREDTELLKVLVEFRQMRDFTQSAVAEKMGVGQSWVSEFETGVLNGTLDPRLSTVRRYAAAIGVLVGHSVDISKLDNPPPKGHAPWSEVRKDDPVGPCFKNGYERGTCNEPIHWMLPDHPFSPSYTARVCDAMVMRNGGGDQCGMPPEAHRTKESA